MKVASFYLLKSNPILVMQKALVSTGRAEQISELFLNVFNKLNCPLDNQTLRLLPTDILRYKVKRKLLKKVALLVEQKFLEILASKKSFLTKKDSETIFRDLVAQSSELFLAEFYGTSFSFPPATFSNSLYFETAVKDSDVLISATFSVLLDPYAKTFKILFAPIYQSAPDFLIEYLLQNLVIEITNCVMSFLVEKISFISDIRQNWYKSTYLSVRNIERFKNEIIWQAYTNAYVERPKKLYNSEYTLFLITERGIQSQILYANRLPELLSLNNKFLWVVNYTEFQDFTVLKTKEIISTLSRGVNYFLTSILGNVIGLVWKGILEGVKK